MARISMTHMVIYIAGLAIVLLLLGMVGSKSTKPSDNPYEVENFELPSVSSSSDVSSGASSLYGWGYDPIDDETPQRRRRRCPSCENIYIDKVDLVAPATDDVCRNCDITKNKDIDKYVLKSSVPPCPDMSDYALKSQLPPAGFNPDEWIRKSDIPPCPVCPDLKDYIKRSEVPPCDANNVCPKCPVCPTCPTCPPCDEKTRVVEKIVYKPGMSDQRMDKRDYLPQSLGSHYPQAGSIWRPKLSDSNSGFISPNVPMAGNAFMSRRYQELAPHQK